MHQHRLGRHVDDADVTVRRLALDHHVDRDVPVLVNIRGLLDDLHLAVLRDECDLFLGQPAIRLALDLVGLLDVRLDVADTVQQPVVRPAAEQVEGRVLLRDDEIDGRRLLRSGLDVLGAARLKPDNLVAAQKELQQLRLDALDDFPDGAVGDLGTALRRWP